MVGEGWLATLAELGRKKNEKNKNKKERIQFKKIVRNCLCQ